MPRIRTIKPEFWSSPDTAACKDPWARLLFIGMWNVADDCGRGIANPKSLAGDVFPNDEWIGPPEIRRMLGGIRRAFGVKFYKIGERPYYAIPSWDGHQKIDKRSGSKHPGPEEGVEYDPDPEDGSDQPIPDLPDVSAESSGGSAEDAPSPRSDSGAGSRNRGTGEQGKTDLAIAAALAVTEPDLFDEFWANYPRKDNKAQARKAWPKACKRLPAERLVKAAEYWAGLWNAAGKDREHIPHASTWLNNDRWNDEPPARPRAAPRVSTTDDFAAQFLAKSRTRPLRALPGGA